MTLRLMPNYSSAWFAGIATGEIEPNNPAMFNEVEYAEGDATDKSGNYFYSATIPNSTGTALYTVQSTGGAHDAPEQFIPESVYVSSTGICTPDQTIAGVMLDMDGNPQSWDGLTDYSAATEFLMHAADAFKLWAGKTAVEPPSIGPVA